MPPKPPNLRRAIALSVAAALATLALKGAAAAATNSVGLLADALESGVNLVAALTAYVSLRYAARPADATHTFGHEKIEFFSSGVEGVLVVLAGLSTVAFSGARLAAGGELQRIDLGLTLAVAAAAINLGVGLHLVRVGRRAGSLLVEADGQHLLSDVWTSVAVVTGLALAALTGWPQLDAVAGAIGGAQVTLIGLRLMRRSFDGLMDRALEPAAQAELRQHIQAALPVGGKFHMLRTRRAGRRVFAEFHLLLDGKLTVTESHRQAHALEVKLLDWRPELAVTVHIEPIDDQTAWETRELEQLGEKP